MMRYMILISYLIVTINGNESLLDSSTIKSSELGLLSISTDNLNHQNDQFETSHKIKEKVHDFETAHQIMHKKPLIKDNYFTQKKFSSKEKPELNPILSALIGEDIKISIESKRQAEYNEITTVPSVLTTIKTTSGLVDKGHSLDEAGSENKHTSRIQIKKGPNGQDYEYEYVYYYYDEDEKDGNENEAVVQTLDKEDKSERNRYTTIDRSATPSKNAVIPKGRSSQPISEEDVDIERLPLNTRFPPRSKQLNPTQSTDDLQQQKKISVKRPSLELVDSDSFNTNEKLQKGSRNVESELEKEEKENINLNNSFDSEDNESTTILSTDEDETENPSMNKVALDLYAILANANLDSTTLFSDDDEDVTSSTIDASGELTTLIDEDATEILTTLPTTTTTTTTTTEAPTTTTTTTTTTEAPISGPLNNRNRFRFRTQNTQPSTEAPQPDEGTQKPKSRFNRPTFGNRNLNNRQTTAQPAQEIEENIAKEEIKTVQSSKPDIRTRNRFNLRGTIKTTTTTAETPSDSSGPSSTAGSAPVAPRVPGRPARPSFNTRTRGRFNPSAASTTPASSDSPNTDEEFTKEKPDDAPIKKATPIAPKSRISLAKPNRFAGRGRAPIGNLNKNLISSNNNETGNQVNAENQDEQSELAETNNNDDKQGAETTTVSGLNRLKSRPRIQISKPTQRPKSEAGPAVAPTANRKPNPLLARRRIGGITTTTTISTPSADENEDTVNENESDDKELIEETDVEKENLTENGQAATEAPRGLGLLANRRRPPLRRPGTFVTSTRR